MTRKEAALRIEDHMEVHRIGKYPHLKIKTALDMALEALKGPSREQVEKMRGEWEPYGFDKRGRGGNWRCTRCGKSYPVQNTFCPHCGSPMDDEAVDILYNNLKKLFEQEDS